MRKKKGNQRPDFVASPHAEVVIVDVLNPNHDWRYPENQGNPKHVKAAVNMRESPAAHWFHKDLIDQAQYRAAVEFRRLWEMGGGAGARAFDYTQEPVDGGGVPDPINIAQIDALRRLRDVEAVLGPADYVLVRDVCGTCLPLGQLFASKWQQQKGSERCRDMLTILAEFWGYKPGTIRTMRA